MKKRQVIFAAILSAVALAGCGGAGNAAVSSAESSKVESSKAETSASAEGSEASAAEPEHIKVGATPSPHAEILEAAKEALLSEGIDIEVVVYNDYVQPNKAVDSGELAANFFQHQPYLDNFNEENGTKVVSVGKIHYEPFGIYAGKSNDLSNISSGAKIAVPNDTTNEARALLLLQDNGIITLKDGAGLTATKQDIVENPYNVEILEVEAAQIPRSIDSVDFAAMNGNYAIDAGFKPSDALAQEDAESEAAQTFANVIAVAEADKDSEWAKKLVKVLQSEDIVKYISESYDGGVIATH